MGDINDPKPALLLIAVSSRYDAALTWAAAQTTQAHGGVRLESPRFDFGETDYYQSTMGTELKKQFLVFDQPFDPGDLAQVKHATNTLEVDYAAQSEHPETRPLNLDPGYLTQAKLVLASTKDHAHRLYLSQGIYAEITLTYRKGRWQKSDWTYPDYQREDFQAFFSQCRQTLRS
jgi:hypothetical protein